jgi:hypothetical protein
MGVVASNLFGRNGRGKGFVKTAGVAILAKT